MRYFQCNVCGIIHNTAYISLDGWKHDISNEKPICLGTLRELDINSDVVKVYLENIRYNQSLRDTATFKINQ